MSASTPTRDTSAELDQLCINTIRALSIDAVQRAESGHPGLPLGAAPMAYVIWTRFMRHNPRNPKWQGRDRFDFTAPVSLAHFSDDGKRLLVLTADQTVYLLDLAAKVSQQ